MLDTRPAPREIRRMQRAVQPTGQERTFGADEVIVSKTDPRGVITYANDVFLRVSGYEHAEVVGQPHNVIRHPAMPTAVFQLLWDTLADRREIFAYVNNLAADGAHYWVLAAAVDGSASLNAGGADITGLSQMAERLRSEATQFLAQMRR